MGPSRGSPLPGRRLFRLLFLLAALDRLGWGLWAVLRSRDVFSLLHAALPEAPPSDQLLLWRLLGVLALADAAFLVILVWRPESFGSAVVVPLLGFALGTGLWLWVYGAARLQLPSRWPPLLLAAHEAVWLPGCVWFLVAWQRHQARTAGTATEAPPARS
jgi:hypothetical protein